MGFWNSGEDGPKQFRLRRERQEKRDFLLEHMSDAQRAQLAQMSATIAAGMYARPNSKPPAIDDMTCSYGSPEHYALYAKTVAVDIMVECGVRPDIQYEK